MFALSSALADEKKASSQVGDRVVSAAVVLKEIAGIPEGIPTDLLNKSACVAVIPSLKKGGFIFGAAYGKGVIACRTNNGEGPWSAPSMISLHGGSFGLQIGAQEVDLVLLIMNLGGLESLLDSKFTLGGDASVAAGPVGRTASAETDAWMSAKILAYSRARGLFGGIVIKGSTLRPDNDANNVLYAKDIRPRSILLNQTENLPKDGKIFVDELTRISPKHVK
ncbi:MAG: lipid-binding SYLF domain-containing protein [Acidobacteriia bacterium]|nr:lipid-binding SYLF domain-containing protein [Terriglobia bacterium]